MPHKNIEIILKIFYNLVRCGAEKGTILTNEDERLPPELPEGDDVLDNVFMRQGKGGELISMKDALAQLGESAPRPDLDGLRELFVAIQETNSQED